MILLTNITLLSDEICMPIFTALIIQCFLTHMFSEGLEVIPMSKGHSREGGNPVFERLSGYPIKLGMTRCYFRRTVMQTSL